MPATNLEMDDDTCFSRAHSPDRRKQEVPCGAWSHGFRAGGSGYGLLTVTRDRLTVEAKEKDGTTVYRLDLSRDEAVARP